MTDQKTSLPTLRTYAHDLEKERARQGLTPSEGQVNDQPTVSPTAAALPDTSKPLNPASKTSVTAEKTIPPPRPQPLPPPAPLPKAASLPDLPRHALPFHALKASAQKQLSHGVSGAESISAITITDDQSGAVVITDNKSNQFKVGQGILDSLKSWWRRLQAERRAKAAPKYVVADASMRKGVIQEATSHTGRSIFDDVAPLRASIKERSALPAVPSIPTVPVVPQTPVVAPIEPQPPTSPITNVSVTPRGTVPTVAPVSVIAPPPEPIMPTVPTVPEVRPVPPAPIPKVVATEPTPIARLSESPRRFRPAPAGRRLRFSTNLIALVVVGVVIVITGVILGLRATGVLTTPTDPINSDPSIPADALVTRRLTHAPTDTLSFTGGDDRRTILGTLADRAAQSSSTLPVSAVQLERAGIVIPPHELLRTIDPQIHPNFAHEVTSLLFGHTPGGMPFMVLGVSDRESAWGGLLQWELTLPTALAPFITATEDASARFVDRRANNYDVRVRTDGSAEEIVYGFVDDGTVVITTDSKTFLEIANLVLPSN